MIQPLTPEQKRLVEMHVVDAQRIARFESRKMTHLDPEEITSWAYQGLIQAAQRFRPDAGVSFKTFLQFRVRGAIIDQVRHDSERTVSRRDYRNGVRNSEASLDALIDANPSWSPTSFDVDIDRSIDLRDAMQSKLTPREYKVMTALAVGMSGTEIAEDLGVTCSRVSQISNNARDKLKEAIAA